MDEGPFDHPLKWPKLERDRGNPRNILGGPQGSEERIDVDESEVGTSLLDKPKEETNMKNFQEALPI